MSMTRNFLVLAAVAAIAAPLGGQTPPQTPPANPAPGAPAGSAPAGRGRGTTTTTPRPPVARPASAGMNNQDVIRMVSAGLPDDVIITAIRQAPRRSFTLTPDGLVALKQGKVSDAVIRVMQAGDSAASAEPVAAPAPPPPPPPPPKPVDLLVPKGTSLQVQLKADLSSKTAKPGDRLEFDVVEDVVVNGQTIVKKGTTAMGRVTDALAQRRRNSAKLEFDVESVKAVNGAEIRLSGKQGAEGRRAGNDVVFTTASPFTAITDEDFKLPQ